MPHPFPTSKPLRALGAAFLIAGLIGAAPALAAESGACAGSTPHQGTMAMNDMWHGGGMAHNTECGKRTEVAMKRHHRHHHRRHYKTKMNDVSHGGGMAHHMNHTGQ